VVQRPVRHCGVSRWERREPPFVRRLTLAVSSCAVGNPGTNDCVKLTNEENIPEAVDMQKDALSLSLTPEQ
jgi:hypothetical protein